MTDVRGIGSEESNACVACGKSLAHRHYNARTCLPWDEGCGGSRAKNRARAAVHTEVAAGRLTSPRALKCIDCGAQARDYDHRDYSKPLDVQPVCRRCNILRGPARRWLPEEIAA